MTPTSTLLDLPPGYGAPARTLDWSDIRTELETARQYWLSTVRVDGRPHVVPLDGLWLDDTWWYGGSEESVHRRTVLRHPAATMHLPRSPPTQRASCSTARLLVLTSKLGMLAASGSGHAGRSVRFARQGCG